MADQGAGLFDVAGRDSARIPQLGQHGVFDLIGVERRGRVLAGVGHLGDELVELAVDLWPLLLG